MPSPLDSGAFAVCAVVDHATTETRDAVNGTLFKSATTSGVWYGSDIIPVMPRTCGKTTKAIQKVCNYPPMNRTRILMVSAVRPET